MNHSNRGAEITLEMAPQKPTKHAFCGIAATRQIERDKVRNSQAETKSGPAGPP
jgi:hypothetical protein